MMGVWYLCGQWLRSAGVGSAASRVALMACGTVAPPFLMVYVMLIGIDSEVLHQIRQLSIRVYFPLAIVAKLLCGWLLVRQLRREPGALIPPWLALTMLATAAGMLLAAILSVVLQHAMDDPSRAHNLLQWHTTTVFIGWYVLLCLAWRASRFRLHFSVASGRPG